MDTRARKLVRPEYDMSIMSPAAIRQRLSAVQQQVDELEQEVERLEDALAGQELYLRDGYLVAVWPMGDGTYIASCPTLHASVQERGKEEAIESLRSAMDLVKDARAQDGRSLPTQDVTNRCLDQRAVIREPLGTVRR